MTTAAVTRRSALLLSLLAISAMAADWPRFRGPNGSAVSDETGLATTWSPSENVLWKTELPGPGSSSPITTGGRVFLTCYTGYGIDRNAPGEPEDLERHLICLDQKDGRVLWQRSIKAKLPEDPPEGFLTEHGYASSTPATDGERVYVLFGKTGVLAFDLEGSPLWEADVGTGSAIMGWGSASSPIVHDNMVIVSASAEGPAMVALDKLTGAEVWKADAEGSRGSWGTPVLARGRDGLELALNVPYEVWGFSLKTGNLLWFAAAPEDNVICTSPVAHDDMVYVVGGRRGGSVAVRAGGRGEVTESHTAWKSDLASYVPSAVLYENHLYWVTDRGIAYCVKADTGETVFQERLGDAGQIYASAVAADGKLYVVTRFNGTFVLAAKPEFERLAQNKLDDESDFSASPAISNGQLILRSNKFCYSIKKG
ncbi:MAG: PQQ-binding-like beta-propeller repeat protein [Pirellulales bacterium]